MRRTTSALTTTILGAVLSASAVSAQQSPPPAGAGAGAIGESDAGFGMAAARGARHLLRNGLDYIEYQEFDRALKYLREAEKRQAELNEPERTKLKQALDRAQRGTREAIGSEKPYALSRRPLRSGGFAPAAAEPAVATARKAPASREGDDRAEPIQLAGAEVPAPSGRAPSRTASAPSALPAIPEGPATAPSPSPAREIVQASAPEALPTAPPVTRIEAADLAPALAAAPDARVAAMEAQADLTSPLPTFDAPPAVDPALTRSAAPKAAEPAPAPAPAPIELERPEDLEAPLDEPLAAPAPAAPDLAPAAAPLPDLGAAPAPAPALAPAAEPVPAMPELADEPLAAPAPAEAAAPAPAPLPDEAPATGLDDAALDLPALPADLRGGYEMEPEAPAAAPVAPPADGPDLGDGLPVLPGDEAPAAAPAPEERPAAVPGRRPAALTAQPEPLDEPAPADEPAQEAAPAPVEESLPEPAEDLPTLPGELDAEEPAAAPTSTPAPAPAAVPDFAPAPTAPSGSGFVPSRSAPRSILSPELERRIDEIASRQEAAERGRAAARTTQGQPDAPAGREAADPADDLTSDVRTQTQIDISRAPSPAEARAISAIPVPEDWVPLGARTWSPQRKYWSAAATCHLPLYFQDPMLERYGHSVENYIGPAGRFFAYPVDNHKQSTQRNQIAQPFASMGTFAFQILTLPYALVMDPPWEAQYDLGYWRPGDKIPTDMYYLPLHGTGPPLKGMKY